MFAKLTQEVNNNKLCKLGWIGSNANSYYNSDPYLYAKGQENQVFATHKHCNFCCSLCLALMIPTNWMIQNNWFDVTIFHQSVKDGFTNYLFTTLPVWRRRSRPWKQQ